MTGVLIIVGVVLAAAIGGLLLHAAAHRFGRSRQRALERHPAPPGRVGRTSEFGASASEYRAADAPGRSVLALVAEPISGEALRAALGDGADAEVLVVAPALDSRSHFWTSDSDQAIGRAEDVQEETVQRMTEQGVDAVGDTGESDPLLAIQDALATFPADEIVIVTHQEGERNWAEDDLVEQARNRFSTPVRELEVETG